MDVGPVEHDALLHPACQRRAYRVDLRAIDVLVAFVGLRGDVHQDLIVQKSPGFRIGAIADEDARCGSALAIAVIARDGTG